MGRGEREEVREGLERGYPEVADGLAAGTDAADGEGGIERGYPGVADEVAPATHDEGVPPRPPATGDAATRVPVGFSSRLDYLDRMERSSALYSRISLEDRNFDRQLMGLAL